MKLTQIGIIGAIFLFVSCNNNKLKQEQTLTKLNQIANSINHDFEVFQNEIEQLANSIQQMYTNKNFNYEDSTNYGISTDGCVYKKTNDGGAAIYVSSKTKHSKEVLDIINFTSPSDSAFKRIINTYPSAVQVYYNDSNNYNRIYPFFDVITQYPPDIQIVDYNFYYLATEKYNPSKKATWVKEPYVDPAGRGWMVSAIAPVYYENQLVGVPGIDITINTIIDTYLENDPTILLLDEKGIVIAGSEDLLGMLYLPPLKNHKYIETIKSDSYLKDDFNLYKSKSSEVRNLANELFKPESTEIFEYVINNNHYTIYNIEIPLLNWKLIKFELAV